MAVVKHMAMNLVKAAPGLDSIPIRRKSAGWDDDDLKALITRIAQ